MRSRTSRDNNVTPLPTTNGSDENALRPDLWDRRYNAREIETLKVVAQQYGLDPLMREVMMLKGNIYVTAAGLQKLAQRDPDYNGCQIEPILTDWENHFFVMKASVYKKGCDFPFEDFGDADPSTSKLRGKALFRHAITRARARAIRSAFAVPFCALEELDDETRWKAAQQEAHEVSKRPQPKKTPTQSAKKSAPQPAATTTQVDAPKQEKPNTRPTADLATTHQHTMLQRYIQQLGWTDQEMQQKVESTFGVKTPEQMTRLQASHLLDTLAEQLKQDKSETPATTKPKKAQAKKTDQPKVEEKAPSPATTQPTKPAPVEVSQTPVSEPVNTGPKWTGVEQQRIAEDLLQRMKKADSLDTLRREWDMFQGLRHKLGADWIEQICETKDQRKSALAA